MDILARGVTRKSHPNAGLMGPNAALLCLAEAKTAQPASASPAWWARWTIEGRSVNRKTKHTETAKVLCAFNGPPIVGRRICFHPSTLHPPSLSNGAGRFFQVDLSISFLKRAVGPIPGEGNPTPTPDRNRFASPPCRSGENEYSAGKRLRGLPPSGRTAPGRRGA